MNTGSMTFLREVAKDSTDRRSLVEHGDEHTGPLLERTGDCAVPLTTRCGRCGVILTRGVPIEIVALAAWHCVCGAYNQVPAREIPDAEQEYS